MSPDSVAQVIVILISLASDAISWTDVCLANAYSLEVRMHPPYLAWFALIPYYGLFSLCGYLTCHFKVASYRQTLSSVSGIPGTSHAPANSKLRPSRHIMELYISIGCIL